MKISKAIEIIEANPQLRKKFVDRCVAELGEYTYHYAKRRELTETTVIIDFSVVNPILDEQEAIESLVNQYNENERQAVREILEGASYPEMTMMISTNKYGRLKKDLRSKLHEQNTKNNGEV